MVYRSSRYLFIKENCEDVPTCGRPPTALDHQVDKEKKSLLKANELNWTLTVSVTQGVLGEYDNSEKWRENKMEEIW